MIYYTGDIHGSAKGIVAFAQHYELTESDIIVILGDVGANYYGNRLLTEEFLEFLDEEL